MISNQPLIKKYALVLIAIIGLLAYANTFNNSFQFDDGYHLIESNKIKNFDNVMKISFWKAINDRPFSFFTLAVNYKIHKLDLPGYHITNLLFHVLAGFIVFLLALEILSLPKFRKNKTVQDYKILIALFSSLIFIAHPIQTQAVTYIIQRMTALAGLFYMWSVLLYIRGRKTHLDPGNLKAWKPYAFYAGAFAAGVFGFLSKQNATSFPLAFILVEILFIRNSEEKIDRKFLITLSSVIGIIIALGLIVNGLPSEFDKMTRAEYLYTQLRVLVKYWQLLFLPVNQNLDYYWVISESLMGYKELLSLAVHLGAIALAVLLVRKNWVIPAFGIFWFYLTLSVESSIIPIRDVIFEHRLYMAVFGFGFAISYLAFYFLSKKKEIYPVIALSVLTLIYVGASLNRNRVWKNPYTLWSDCVKKAPKRERAWYWLASHYTLEKDMENAMKCYNTSIECNPGFPLAYNGRGNMKKESGDLSGAYDDYSLAIKLDPTYMTAYYNRGIANAALNRLDEAIQDYDKSLQLGNRSSAVFYNRGNAKRRKKNFKAAIEDYNISISIDPNYALAYYNRGLTRAGMNDHNNAIADIDQAIKLDANNHLFYNGKGVSLLQLGKYYEAIDNFSKSIQLNPGFGQAYYNRGYTKFTGLKDLNGACEDWKIASEKGYKSANSYLKNYCQ